MGIKGTAHQRFNFAVQHLIAAVRFARLCYTVEEANTGKAFGPFYEEIISYVTASVFSSVAALEANINEVFADAQDGIITFEGFGPKLLNEIWDLIEDKPILEKYQFALVLRGRERMSKGDREYQFAGTLIKVRNALVHFKPEWDHEQQEHNKIGKQLRCKFKLSPFVDENVPIFPMRCMTHGFADWAVRSSLNFADHFAQGAGFPNRFVQFLWEMKTTPE